MVIDKNYNFINDVYLQGHMIINNNLYCNGVIFFEDISDLIRNQYGMTESIHIGLEKSDYMISVGDLFIDGNIVFNKNNFSSEDIYEKVKIISDNIIHPKTNTIKCKNFFINGDISIKNNTIFVTDGRVISKLRELKIKKFKKND